MRALMSDDAEITEAKMFGGLAFLLRGHMAVCATAEGVMVRVEAGQADEVVRTTAAEPVVMRGSSMRSWVTVGAGAVAADAQLAAWIARGLAVAGALPPKTAPARATRAPAPRSPAAATKRSR